MPEHREGTPERFKTLESFLWHEFSAGPGEWSAWNRRLMPAASEAAVTASYHAGLQLHHALRAMQRRNNGLESDDGNEERLLLNRLIATFGVQPNIHEAGQVVLIASDQTNPAACLLLMALEAMQFGVWRRFKVCREPTCRASYYDASKAAVKTWCSMETCGSRNKMRRYRTRRVEL